MKTVKLLLETNHEIYDAVVDFYLFSESDIEIVNVHVKRVITELTMQFRHEVGCPEIWDVTARNWIDDNWYKYREQLIHVSEERI